MQGRLRQTSPPAAEPITLAEAKAHLRVDLTDEDALITSRIAAARKYAERITARALITQTFALDLDSFPGALGPHTRDRLTDAGILSVRAGDRYRGYRIELPNPPLQQVDSITYLDSDGTEQTLAPSVYRVIPSSETEPGYVMLRSGQVWPTTYPEDAAVTVNYTAGFGDASTDVPEDIRLAILYLVAHSHENRSPVEVGTTANPVPMTIDAMLDTARIISMA